MSTDADGSYRLEIPTSAGSSAIGDEAPLLGEGIFRMKATAEGHAPVSRIVCLAVPEGAERRIRVDFTLDRALGIVGRIVDARGVPIPGVVVGWTDGRLDSSTESGESDPSGRFRLPGAVRGFGTLTLSPPQPPRGDHWLRQDLRHLVPSGDAEVEIVLHSLPAEGATLEVETLEAGKEGAVHPKTAYLVPMNSWADDSEFVPPKGRRHARGATFEEVPTGRWRVWVQTYGGEWGYRDFVVEDGDRDHLGRIVVGGSGGIRGTVDFGDATKRVGLRVEARLHPGIGVPSGSIDREGAKPYGTAPVRGEGTFAVDGLLPGEYLLSILDDGIAAEGRAIVEAGGNAFVDLRATRSATLVLRTSSPPPISVPRFHLHHEGRLVHRFEHRRTPLSGAEDYEVRIPVPPGTIRWTLTFTRSGERRDAVALAEPQAGEVSMGPGEKRVVEVPVVAIPGVAGDR